MAPFKIIQGHCNCRDRLATYDFLLVFHSNYGPISYLIEIKENIGKIFLPTHIKGEAFFICVSHATIPREWGISIPKFLGDTPPYVRPTNAAIVRILPNSVCGGGMFLKC